MSVKNFRNWNVIQLQSCGKLGSVAYFLRAAENYPYRRHIQSRIRVVMVVYKIL